MKKICKILSIRINLLAVSLALVGCAAPAGQQAKEDIGPVSAYARNSLAAENPEGLIRLGEGFERSGDYAGARALYAQALETDPNLTEARIALARTSAKMGRTDEAVASLILLLQEKPENREARVTLAQIHAAAGRYQAASEAMSLVVGLNPSEQMFAGKLLQAVGQPQEGHVKNTGCNRRGASKHRNTAGYSPVLCVGGRLCECGKLVKTSIGPPTNR